MFIIVRNIRGISLIETLIATFLIMAGMLATMTLQPSGWRLSRTSDSLGRAAGILQAELEANEALIMNGNNAVSNTPIIKTPVYGSGGTTPARGDIPFTVQTTRTNLGARWRVTVQVTWPGNPVGIRESLIVIPQASFTP